MPVVLTDYTNKVWAMEQPNDGRLHVGWTGQAGPKLEDLLDFVLSRQKQFDAFINKKQMGNQSGRKETKKSG